MAATVSSQLQKLREPFSVDQVKQRPGGGGRMLDYVSIETALGRLLEVAPDYSMTGSVVSDDGKTAIAECSITALGKTGYGVGAMTNTDADMRVKSALSEAIKNSLKNGFGVALELWDADHREELENQRQGLTVVTSQQEEELTNLKNRVADIAVLQGVDRTGPSIAAHFGITIEQLQDRETLEGIISQQTAVAI